MMLPRIMADMAAWAIITKAIVLFAHHRTAVGHSCTVIFDFVFGSVVSIDDATVRWRIRQTVLQVLIVLAVQSTCLHVCVSNSAGVSYTLTVVWRTKTAAVDFCFLILGLLGR